ncbi:Carbonic anhydrase [Penicillium oxalicum]|uniref:Carbonic anhydrase n=1 Tax=Penicillium oxalicum TaxID=69781 RepID=UPI0020B8855D|nr:Carbonic anhydrase [Penicillium oxalicum]KAI2786623.1 Carbonic anhydrase [Penicillium oxalicum]
MADEIKQKIATIFENNQKWVSAKKEGDAAFFDKLAQVKLPSIFPNIDLNVMSVVNYAVRHLGVKHIIVCGHYNCGGVKAALTPTDLGLLNPWLRNIRDDETKRYNRLVELNVIESCRNVIKTAAVQQSYRQKQYPIVHGWVFDLQDGLLRDLKIDFEDMLKDVMKIYHLSEDSLHSETSGGA